MVENQQIIDILKEHGSSTSREISKILGISRQALNVRIRELLGNGQIVKTGSTRSARYYLSDDAPKATEFKKSYLLKNLDENRAYEQAAAVLNLNSALSHDQGSIINYAFTEMLNNAIDHSYSEKCEVLVSLDAAKTAFKIRDRGIGVFDSIASRLQLEDEHVGMIELIKGKTTTMPEAHSGEGIFFTSNAADRFTLKSHRIQLTWDKLKHDVFVSEIRYLKGTLVEFEINRSSRTKLENVFSEYAPEEFDYEFSKTRIMVKLLKPEYISRSEAKRLIVNLDKFREIELDFRNVTQVGQGFADEVFRVFALRHPNITIKVKHTNPPVLAMIKHVSNHTETD